MRDEVLPKSGKTTRVDKLFSVADAVDARLNIDGNKASLEAHGMISKAVLLIMQEMDISFSQFVAMGLEMEQILATFQDRTAGQDEEIGALTKALHQTQAENASLKDKTRSVQSTSNQSAENDRLKAEVAKLKAENNDLEKQLKKAKAQPVKAIEAEDYKDLARRYILLNGEWHDATSKVDNDHLRITELEKDLRELQLTLKDATDVSELQDQMAYFSKSIAPLSATLTALADELQRPEEIAPDAKSMLTLLTPLAPKFRKVAKMVDNGLKPINGFVTIEGFIEAKDAMRAAILGHFTHWGTQILFPKHYKDRLMVSRF